MWAWARLLATESSSLDSRVFFVLIRESRVRSKVQWHQIFHNFTTTLLCLGTSEWWKYRPIILLLQFMNFHVVKSWKNCKNVCDTRLTSEIKNKKNREKNNFYRSHYFQLIHRISILFHDDCSLNSSNIHLCLEIK